jgi:hypothetical protein
LELWRPELGIEVSVLSLIVRQQADVRVRRT